jgi:hypothetical protein
MERISRRQVEAEIERARAAEEKANPIPEGAPYPTLEDVEPQLNNKDMSGVNLSGFDLSNANLSYSDLRGADFTNTRLVMAELNHVILRNTTLTEGADFRGANMSFAELQGADLSKAILRGDDPPLWEPASPLILYNAQYDKQTRWPAGFEPDEFGAVRVGG